jgi:hypothetical protein
MLASVSEVVPTGKVSQPLPCGKQRFRSMIESSGSV